VQFLVLLCPLGLLFVGAAIAGVLGFLAFRAGQKVVKPAKVVKCRVAEMREGVCKVRGRLVAREEPLKSPLTSKECIFFRFHVEQAYEIKVWRTSHNAALVLTGANESTSERETWRPLLDDVRHVAVALEDETGRVHLDLGDAQTDGAAKTKEGVIHTSQASGLPFEMMLQKRYGESTLVARRANRGSYVTRGGSGSSEGRELPKAMVREEIIENGAEVTVVGEVELREGKPPRFRPVDHPLIVARKSSRAYLPTPSHPAMGLWIAAGVVLGLTVLVFLMSMAVACSGLNLGPRPVAPAPARPFGH
jgi:hypothetical protein